MRECPVIGMNLQPVRRSYRMRHAMLKVLGACLQYFRYVVEACHEVEILDAKAESYPLRQDLPE